MTPKDLKPNPNPCHVDADYLTDSVCDFNKVVDKTTVSIEIVDNDSPKLIKVDDVFAIIDKYVNTYLVKIEALEFIINDYDRGFKHHISKEDKHRMVSKKYERCCFIKNLNNIKHKIENL